MRRCRSHPANLSAYSEIRPRRTFFRSITNASFSLVDPGLVVDVAAGIRKRDRFRSHIDQLLDRVLRDVAAAGDQASLARQLLIAASSASPRRSRLRHNRSPRDESGEPPQVSPLPVSTPVNSFRSFLYIPKRKPISRPPTPMSPAGTSRIRSDVAGQLRHERLAEAHHFVVALSFRIEVGAALPAAHRQAS